MEIHDLYGKAIKVTDLTAAIAQAGTFKGYRHADRKHSAFDRERELYWKDVYQKLLQLQSDNNKTGI